MPNHLHLIAVEPSAEAALTKLRATMSGVRRSAPGKDLAWQRAPTPVIVPDALHLQRQLRYVARSPSRAGLVGDPLEWMWSTHRDVMGAVVDPWVRADTIARRLGRPLVDFALWQHAYVSGDPTVSIDGTPAPIAAGPSRLAQWPLNAIALAARAATRAGAIDLRRRSATRSLFIDLARACGWRDAEVVALACDTTPDTIRLHARRGQSPAHAAWLCLGDPRLRNGHHPRIATRPGFSVDDYPIARGSARGRDSGAMP